MANLVVETENFKINKDVMERIKKDKQFRDKLEKDFPNSNLLRTCDKDIRKGDLLNSYFPVYIYESEGIEAAAIRITASVANNVLLYRFLKSIVNFYNTKSDTRKYRNIIHGLKAVIHSSSLIS